MSTISDLFFDLDHTLWDYDKSAEETLTEIYQSFDLGHYEVSRVKFLQTFYQKNDRLWQLYNQGEIDRDYIKENRFKQIFEILNIPTSKAKEASTYFLTHCAQKPYLIPDADTLLAYLEPRYRLHIITNGFKDAQTRKLESAGILKYFQIIVTSECTGARKPSPEIFEYAVKKASTTASKSLMIGDNPKTDILGGRQYGMQTILFDPSGRKKSLADLTVGSLFELIKVL